MIRQQPTPYEVWWKSRIDYCYRHAASFANVGSAVLFRQQSEEAPDCMEATILNRKDRSYKTVIARMEQD